MKLLNSTNNHNESTKKSELKQTAPLTVRSLYNMFGSIMVSKCEQVSTQDTFKFRLMTTNILDQHNCYCKELGFLLHVIIRYLCF